MRFYDFFLSIQTFKTFLRQNIHIGKKKITHLFAHQKHISQAKKSTLAVN